MSEHYNVGAVPMTVVNDKHTVMGLLPEERFVVEAVTLKSAEQALMDSHEHHHHHHHDEPAFTDVDVVIVGAGPAGLTAGIYAERSGLKSVILEKHIVGGQVAVTPIVENYPGWSSIPGKKLMDIMADHAREYAHIHEGESVNEIKIGRDLEIHTDKGAYRAKALILATGADWKKIGCTGEDVYSGQGVSYCSSCDGYIYKGRKVLVVGGGNSALTDALHLKNLGVDVTIVHRRDAFRAEKHLQDALIQNGISVIWNTVVEEILGEAGRVNRVRVRDVKTGDVREIPTDGVFVAVGLNPNTDLAEMIGLALDERGFIKVDARMRTSIPRVFAAGDVTGGVQQITTAVGAGAAAALTAFEDITHPYWKRSGGAH